MDIPEFYALLEALFSPQQAEINNVLTRKPATAADIAGRLQQDETRTAARLNEMADLGLCFTTVTDGCRYYQGVPFMPGIFEYQFLPGRSSEREKKITLSLKGEPDATCNFRRFRRRCLKTGRLG